MSAPKVTTLDYSRLVGTTAQQVFSAGQLQPLNALTGGGAITVPAFCNGSAWTAH